MTTFESLLATTEAVNAITAIGEVTDTATQSVNVTGTSNQLFWRIEKVLELIDSAIEESQRITSTLESRDDLHDSRTQVPYAVIGYSAWLTATTKFDDHYAALLMDWRSRLAREDALESILPERSIPRVVPDEWVEDLRATRSIERPELFDGYYEQD